jgi:2-oxoglutarate dehydrogenase E1 component
VIVDNQVGFTTSPEDLRPTRYPSDVASFAGAPVIHVNGDDPEAAVRAASVALQIRNRHHRDVIIHLVCDRRHGHNETDDPTFTQPLMYQRCRRRNARAEGTEGGGAGAARGEVGEGRDRHRERRAPDRA